MSRSGIYGLTDEAAREVRYVGRAFGVEKRYGQHLAEGRRATLAALRRGWLEAPIMRTKLNWLAYMGLEGKPVGLVLLEAVEPDLVKQDDREYVWAKALSALGAPLANGTTAGMHVGNYLGKGTCPYTQDLPLRTPDSIESPDGLLRLRPAYPVIPVLALPALSRLRKDAPDLHAEVVAGRLTAHAAMVKVGFWPKTFTVRVDDAAATARTLRKHMPPEQLAELARMLGDE